MIEKVGDIIVFCSCFFSFILSLKTIKGIRIVKKGLEHFRN